MVIAANSLAGIFGSLARIAARSAACSGVCLAALACRLTSMAAAMYLLLWMLLPLPGLSHGSPGAALQSWHSTVSYTHLTLPTNREV